MSVKLFDGYTTVKVCVMVSGGTSRGTPCVRQKGWYYSKLGVVLGPQTKILRWSIDRFVCVL